MRIQGEKAQIAKWYLDDLVPFVDCKMLGFIMCAGRKSQSNGEKKKRKLA